MQTWTTKITHYKSLLHTGPHRQEATDAHRQEATDSQEAHIQEERARF
jgi:hypothetical protein